MHPKGCNNRINPQNKFIATNSWHNNTETGASLPQRVACSKVLTAEDAQLYTAEKVLGD